MHLHLNVRKFALVCLPYYLGHGIEIFSIFFIITRRHCSSLEIEKKMQSVIKLMFISFTFKQEVGSSSEIFVITKWTNQSKNCGLKDSFADRLLPIKLHIFRQKFILTLLALGQKQ